MGEQLNFDSGNKPWTKRIALFYLLVLSLTIILTGAGFKNENKISLRDFKNLKGYWSGTLTYLDYSSGEPYTMPADVEIKRMGKTNKFIFSNIYPNEPEANSFDTMMISQDGSYIDNQLVISKHKLPMGVTEIVTEELGVDGSEDKTARFKYTYTISKLSFTKRKDVQFTGTEEWIKRHEYSYKKKLD